MYFYDSFYIRQCFQRNNRYDTHLSKMGKDTQNREIRFFLLVSFPAKFSKFAKIKSQDTLFWCDKSISHKLVIHSLISWLYSQKDTRKDDFFEFENLSQQSKPFAVHIQSQNSTPDKHFHSIITNPKNHPQFNHNTTLNKLQSKQS